MATYRGSPFEAGIGPADGDIVLFAACPPPEELGFEPATGHWRKQLRFADVQAVWESRPVGIFRGERCMVLDDLGDRLHIGYLGHDGYKAEQLGYWQVDRGVFELVAPRTEVTDIVEERTDYSRPADSADVPRQPQDQPFPAGYPAGERQGAPGYPAEGWRNSDGWQNSGGYPRQAQQDPASYTANSGSYTVQGQRDSAGYPVPAARPDPAGYQAFGRQPEPASYPPPAVDLPQPAGYGTPGTQNSPDYSWRTGEPSGQYAADPAIGLAGSQINAAAPPVYRSVPDETTGVALPVPAEPPLPLEAEALRAASASRRPRQPAAQPGPLQPGPMQPAPVRGAEPAPTAPAHPEPARPGPAHTAPAKLAPARQRRSARRRMATERLFADLAALAGIPANTYAVGEEVEGSMCLIQGDRGFEVFHSAGGARHELQVFASEESACFYLFGVLAAEAVRNGTLGRMPADAEAL